MKTSEPVKETTPVVTKTEQKEVATVEPVKTTEVAPKVEAVPVVEIPKTNKTETPIVRSKSYQFYVNEMTEIMKK